MGIVFYCQSCGARFEVAARMAGKKGHCKKCGQMMTIPPAEQLASMAAMPALAGAGVAARPAGQSIGGWLRSGSSDPMLAPISVDGLRFGSKKSAATSLLDDAEDSKPYILAQPTPKSRRGSSGSPNVALGLWRGQLRRVQRLLRNLSGFAYLLSIPFLITLLFGTALHNRPLALFAATVVILLNVGRIIAGAANLAVVPLRDGTNLQKLKKPSQHLVEPVLTIGLVILAFAFIPWLRTGSDAQGSVLERIRGSAKDLRAEAKGTMGKAVDKAKALDLEKLGEEAQERLKSIGKSDSETAEKSSKQP